MAQQELPMWKPYLTTKKTSLLLAVFGLLLIAVGALCDGASKSVVEVRQRYDDLPGCAPGGNNDAREEALHAAGGDGIACEVDLEIPDDMEPPIYVYYRLDNFFQNHRRFEDSLPLMQLRGLGNGEGEATKCSPQLYLDGDKNKIIYPCGLVAWSFFNDTYSIRRAPAADAAEGALGNVVPVAEKDIAWSIDLEDGAIGTEPRNFNTEEYKPLRGGGTVNGKMNEDEHFAIWTRAAMLPQFLKVWGRIDEPLKKGEKLKVQVDNRYNTYKFDGRKHIVLSTVTWMGGKNDFIGGAFIGTGVIFLLCAAGFLTISFKKVRDVADTNKLSWMKKKK